ncbi:hypothetical protein AGR7C_Cc150056 [Agrobacterium deltaense Zutra 3/1]|uniref:Uncharacterized protein n=1 Tax=Agrobacterium deltaense Zutra 3/1 TaxID=1183427 RepID=A0A1S7PEP1_9HYPH|nr:hypothetical protein AGR7C_Cc150056 [Agrobacterium deltaense Zutra 3/1]
MRKWSWLVPFKSAPFIRGVDGVAPLATWLPVGSDHAQVWALTDALDVHHDGCLCPALAELVFREGEESLGLPFPIAVIATLAGAGALLVVAGIALPLQGFNALAGLTTGMSLVAVSAD